MTGRVAIIRTAAPVVAALVAILVPAAAQAGETTRSAERRPDGARAVGWTSDEHDDGRSVRQVHDTLPE